MMATTKTKPEPYIDRFFDAFEELWWRLNEDTPYHRELAELRAHPSTVSELITSLATPTAAAAFFTRTLSGGSECGELFTQAGPLKVLSLPTWRPFGGATLRTGLILVMNDLGAGVGLIDLEHKHKPKAGVYTNQEFITRVIEETADPQHEEPASLLKPQFQRRKAAWNF